MAPINYVILARVENGNVVPVDTETDVSVNETIAAGDESTELVAENSARARVMLVNQGDNPVFLGFGVGAEVTGFPLRPTDPPFVTTYRGAINGIVATGTEDVAVFEESRQMALTPVVAPISDAHIGSVADTQIDAWYVTHGPTAGDVITGNNRTIVGTGVGAATDVATTYIYAERYGALSSSTGAAATNVTTLNAAFSAANTAGAIVVVPPMSIPINALITVSGNVRGLIGGGMYATTFLATHASAGFYFTGPSYGKIWDWQFDGDGIATQGVRIDTCNGLSVGNVSVINTVGDSLRPHNVQNSHFDNLEIKNNTNGLWVDDGCGSCVFTALKSSDNEYYELKIGNSGVVASGYDQPTLCTFLAPMLEMFIPATGNFIANVVITGSAGCSFINANVAVPAVSAHIGYLIGTSGSANESSVGFHNCAIIGDQSYMTAISASGTGAISFTGRNGITGAIKGLELTDSAKAIQGILPEMNSVTTAYAFSGGGHYGQLTQYESGERFFTALSYGYALRVQEFGRSGVSFGIQTSGTLEWYSDPDSFSPDVQLKSAGVPGVLSTEGTSQMIRASGGFINRTKAGTPTDADTIYDTDGTQIVDTSASKLWIRIGGAWKSVTLS